MVVVDDGSTDESRNIIRGFGRRVRLHESAHRGAAAARNRGQEVARGDYWLFLDADDVLLPDAATALLDAIQRTRANCAYGNIHFVDAALVPIGDWLHQATERSTVRQFLKAVPITSGVLCSSKSKITWDETKFVCNEFYYFMMRAIDGDIFVPIPQFTALVREHGAPDRLSNGNSATFMSVLGQYWEEIELRLWQKNLIDSDVRAILSDKYLGLCIGCRRAGLRELSKQYAAKVDGELLRKLPDFRWFSSRGAFVLGGARGVTLANEWLEWLRHRSITTR